MLAAQGVHHDADSQLEVLIWKLHDADINKSI